MSRFLKNISGLFGYSRRERRASFILLIIIFLIIIFRFLLPSEKSSLKIISPVILYSDQPVKREKTGDLDTAMFFDFDPNNASAEELTMLGMNEQQFRTVIKYREKGGRFRKAQDLNRIYGMDSLLVRKLLPFVKIAEQPKELQKVTRPDTLKKHFRAKNVLAKTDLNRCDSADLEKLPWIGPVLSARIIKYRELLGGFCSIDQLKEVYGLSDSTFNFISGRVTADSNDIKQIEINKAKFAELIKHPYFELFDVKALLKYRAIRGNIDSIPELVENKILTPGKAARIRPYIRF
jgi:DNA uptake protein ComE-like DNA-binding protein